MLNVGTASSAIASNSRIAAAAFCPSPRETKALRSGHVAMASAAPNKSAVVNGFSISKTMTRRPTKSSTRALRSIQTIFSASPLGRTSGFRSMSFGKFI